MPEFHASSWPVVSASFSYVNWLSEEINRGRFRSVPVVPLQQTHYIDGDFFDSLAVRRITNFFQLARHTNDPSAFFIPRPLFWRVLFITAVRRIPSPQSIRIRHLVRRNRFPIWQASPGILPSTVLMVSWYSSCQRVI